jgi:DNA invertase Pin-like site-specific DNA recombinase
VGLQRASRPIFVLLVHMIVISCVVMAWAIDRLECSLVDLLGAIRHVENCGVDLYLDQQNVDTT